MNILFLNSIGKNKFGGGEKWMIKAAQGLSRAGHRVVISGRKKSLLTQAASAASVQTRSFPLFFPFRIFLVRHYIRSQSVDLVVCNLSRDAMTAGLAVRAVGKTAVIARHGVLQYQRPKWRYHMTCRFLIDGILTNTESIKKHYLNYGWFKEDFVKVIYNGIEDKSSSAPYPFSRQFPDKKVIFGAGRLSSQKGFSYLAEAAALLGRERKDLVFIVAGRGRLKRRLTRLARELRIDPVFHFWDYAEKIDSYFKGCDLFVLSSLFEGMPNVVMEAMAAGKAVVATDVNGVRELMEDGRTGLIVPPKDPVRLAEAIGRLIDDPTTLKRFGQNGLERVRTHFTIPAMIRNLESFFAEKIDECRKR
jgi:glycosyltransferase involved in cell wall biosynthesis